MIASKFRKSVIGSDEDGKMDMSPMIDMVFLLLIFFIVNATAITVKRDPEVEPPTASNGITGEVEGRIVINVREDGTYTAEDLTVLPDEDAAHHYIQTMRDQLEARALTPKLHLRGDKSSLFKHGRAVVRAAAKAKVEQVIFSSYLREH